MQEFQSICRKKIALIIANTDSQNDLRIFTGKIILTKNARYYFVSQSENWEIEIEPDIIKKLQPVQDESKDILLGADYYFWMEVTDPKQLPSLQASRNT